MMILKHEVFCNQYGYKDYDAQALLITREELLCRFVNDNHIEQKDILSVYDTTHGEIVLIYWSKEKMDDF